MTKLIIESVTLIFITEKEKLISKTIPFSSIRSLNLFNIETDVGHTVDGEFLELLTVGVTDLQIYKNKIDDSLLEILDKYSISGIKLNLNDNTSKAYNVKWSSDNKVKNEAQVIDDVDDVLIITIA